MLTGLITAADAALRDRSLEAACGGLGLPELLAECAELDAFRRRSENLYHRVRALFFLYAIHRFHLPARLAVQARVPDARRGHIPFRGFEHLLARRFEEAIDSFLAVQASEGPSDGVSSALAAAYQRLAFQTLANQVRRSVRSVRGNQWMFRMGHPADHPLRIEEGAPGEERRRAPTRSCASGPRSGWTSPTAAGATSSSSAWTTPRGRRS